MKNILIILSLCIFNRCYEYIDINSYDDIDNINKYHIKNYVIPNYNGNDYDKKYAMYLKKDTLIFNRINYYDCNKIY